jgi:TPR repeat protein
VEQSALAFQFLIESAEKGVAEAQLAVAESYANAVGVEQDGRRALEWYLRAASQGLAGAQFALGQAHERGMGIAEDVGVATQWYREAAAHGHPGAQLSLDRLDAEGSGRLKQSVKGRVGGRERRTTDTRWIKYAAHGRAEDFYHLGVMFELGVSVEKSARQARVWFKKAAEAGHADAQFALARSFESSDSELSIAWYQKAAAQGRVDAQITLAECYQRGLGVAQDRMSAVNWHARAAAQGHATAQFGLATLLQTEKDAIIFDLLSGAAAGGHSGAQCAMGDRYAKGTGVAQNWFEACRWYDMAAQQGEPAAQCALAACYARGRGIKRDIALAFHWFEKAAAQNLPQAQWNLGELYATGLPGVEPDPKKATQLCKRAANAGFAPASATLGALFARAKKHERAVRWWTLAAEQGDLESLFNLGQAHRLGLGTAKDEARAFELFLKAALAGVAAAQSRIGLAYATGEGAALDPIEAYKWIELAATRGDKAAVANRARARKLLSPAQQAEAERRASEWTLSQINKA